MKISKVLASVSAFGSYLYLASAVQAESATSLISGINTTGNGTDLMGFLKNLINYAIALAALVCVVILIGSGYMYITAAGDEDKINKATKSLTWAIIGLVICFISVILVQFVLKDLLKSA